jgi:hypothetical protein
MIEPLKYTFTFSDGNTHNASISQTSNPLTFCFDYGWSLVPKPIGLDQNPVYTIEVSNDDLTWQPYDNTVIDAAIDQPFDDTHLVWTKIRINYDAKTNTTGTIEFTLTLKR